MIKKVKSVWWYSYLDKPGLMEKYHEEQIRVWNSEIFQQLIVRI